MTISKQEQETIVLYNESDSLAEVYTHNGKLKRRLEQMALEFPVYVKRIKVDPNGGVTYELPKNLVGIRRPVSEATRKKLRERALESNLMPPGRGSCS